MITLSPSKTYNGLEESSSTWQDRSNELSSQPGLPELHAPAMGMTVFTAHVSEPFRNAVVGVTSGGLIGTPGGSHGANRLRIEFEIDRAKISGPPRPFD